MESIVTGFLDREQLKRFGGTQPAQEAFLRAEGIPFRHDRRGGLLVCWCHVREWVEGRPPVRFAEPDFASLER